MGEGGSLEHIAWTATDFSCTTCGEPIPFADEVFVLTIMLVQMTERGVQYSPLLFEDGDFLYEPHFFCFSCCENNKEELEGLVRDMPPVEDNYSILDCSACKSGIRSGEVSALITHGEIHLSKRSPNGESGGSRFTCMDDDPTVICISCVNRLNKDVVDELWYEYVKQYKECSEGTQIRCWRNGCPADEEESCANCNKETE